jgi:hypothetical protein
MDAPSMQEFLAGGARGLVESQLALDEAGRDSIDGWDETGVPPSVFTWSLCLLSCPVSVELRPKQSAGERTDAGVSPGGVGEITMTLRYLLAPQGVDDPRPLLPEEQAWWEAQA